MRIVKIAIYTFFALVSGNLSHSAYASTPKVALKHPKPPAEIFASQPFTAATYSKTDLASESQYLLGTKPRQLSGTLTEDFTKTKAKQKQETLKQRLRTDRIAQQMSPLRHPR